MCLWSTVYEVQINDLEFWPSRSSKVKGHLIFEFRIHDFLLVSNSKYVSTKHRLWDTDQWPWVLTFKVKGHLIFEFRIHDFLLVCNSKYGSTKHRLRDFSSSACSGIIVEKRWSLHWGLGITWGTSLVLFYGPKVMQNWFDKLIW